jgi:hypothetical protein
MVYMQAGDTSQLDNLAVRDLLEMENGVRGNPNVHVLVHIQRRWPAVPQRYLLKPAGLPETVEGPKPEGADDDLLNMGTSRALADFLDTALKQGQKSKPEKYCLVLWGHAFGLGFGRDHGDALHLHELQTALKSFTRKRKKRLDILATNSCTMSYIEAAYQLKEEVQYLAASQVFVPLTGLPYKEVLSSIHSETDAEDLGRTIVNRYVDHFAGSPQGERVAMTLLDLQGADDFKRMLDELARRITDVIGQVPNVNIERLSEVQDVFFVNPAGDVRPVLDLHSLAVDLKELAADLTASSAKSSAQSRLKVLRSAAIQLEAATDDGSFKPQAGRGAYRGEQPETDAQRPQLIVYHKAHPDLEGLHGIGVFAPFVVDKEFRDQLEIDSHKKKGRDEPEGRSHYERLHIFAAARGRAMSGWPQLVYDTLRREEPDEIVGAAGVVLPTERRQVNQLLVAVEAAFNRLDRALSHAERRIVDGVVETKGDRESAESILRSFGPPHLTLCGDVSLEDYESYKASPPKGSAAPRTGAFLVPTLTKIEKALQLVEKTTRTVVTNRTFGLGPPDSRTPGLMHLGPKPAGDIFGPKPAGDIFGPKPAGDIFGPKPAGDIFGPKPAGDIFGPKPAGDIFGPSGSETGALLAVLTSNAQASGLAVSTLVAQIALALVRLEQAAADIERTVAQFLFSPAYGARLSHDDYVRSVESGLGRVFDIMREVTLQARRTLRRVLAHPVYGLGPGPEGLEQAERDELAAAAGLNQRNLLLL